MLIALIYVADSFIARAQPKLKIVTSQMQKEKTVIYILQVHRIPCSSERPNLFTLTRIGTLNFFFFGFLQLCKPLHFCHTATTLVKQRRQMFARASQYQRASLETIRKSINRPKQYIDLVMFAVEFVRIAVNAR